MARSCGIRLGARRFEIVALEGNAKKAKVIAAGSGEIPAGEDRVAATAQALREAAKRLGVAVDNVGLSVDTGMATFRSITLPFQDRGKIEDVLKFEVENQLPQLSIDEVVVDFLSLSTKAAESQLLVTAVRKARLKPLLDACEQAGLAAFDAELESTAVLNAAHVAGVFDPAGAQILVHVGESATAVMVVDGGQLRTMRAIHIGALEPSAADAPAPAGEGGADAAKAAEGAAETAARVTPTSAQSIARLRRELHRTILGTHTDQPLGAIYVCGFEVADLLDSGELGAPVHKLELFAAGEGGADAPPTQYMAAYGAALARLGDVFHRAHLRREELAYAGKFERLELPLAVAGLLLVALLSVYLIITFRFISNRERELTGYLVSVNNYMLGDPKQGRPGSLKRPPEAISKYADDAEQGRDVDRTRFEQLARIKTMLSNEIAAKQKLLGQDKEVTKPQSALEGLTLVLGVLSDMGDRVGRVGLRDMSSDYQMGTGGRTDSVAIKISIAFYADDSLAATEHYNAFLSEMQTKPWCLEANSKPTKPLDGVGGIWVENLAMTLDLSKIQRDAIASSK